MCMYVHMCASVRRVVGALEQVQQVFVSRDLNAGNQAPVLYKSIINCWAISSAHSWGS